MSDITQASERAAEKAALRISPEGFALWAVYPTKGIAEMIRDRSGHHTDIIKQIKGYWALFGRSLV